MYRIYSIVSRSKWCK